MSEETKIEQEKLKSIIEYATSELQKRADGMLTKEGVISHIVEKMKEVLSDDN